MPICERDPWRFQYFENIPCPDNVRVPTDDPDCWEWYPQWRWIYDKLKIARSQGLACGSHDDVPATFPVFSKPAINLKGMGTGSHVISSPAEFEAHRNPGHMWMTLLEGPHVSTDCAIADGKIMWMRHATGIAWTAGMFKHWIIQAMPMREIETYIAAWVARFMQGYTGMMNFETIGGRIIETHLRFADQWCDLYGAGWIEALIGLYHHGRWSYQDRHRVDGYSVPLFAKHGLVPRHPSAALQSQIRALPGIASLQVTFHEQKPGKDHPMPPGGFRLAIVNCWNLEAGKQARMKLAAAFPGVDVMVPE